MINIFGEKRKWLDDLLATANQSYLTLENPTAKCVFVLPARRINITVAISTHLITVSLISVAFILGYERNS